MARLHSAWAGIRFGRGLFDMCRVNADVFPSSLHCKHRHRRFRNRCPCRCETQSLELVTRAGAQPHDATFIVSDKLTQITDKLTVKCVTRSPCIDPADLSVNIYQSSFKINRVETAVHSAKLFTHVLVEEKCPDATDVRIEVSRAWSLTSVCSIDDSDLHHAGVSL